ncbi:hypothetical protein [Dyella sp.]|uniref:hypothetical protein n=1 Tax=Dyella sp. TaxID=1869338 RepID=UPI002ED378A8
MKKSRFTEEQIAYALKQAELGTTIDACSRRSITEHPRKPKPITIRPRAHCAKQRDSNQTVSGKPGASIRCRMSFDQALRLPDLRR